MNIVPKPQSIKLHEGWFAFSASTAIEGASELIRNELMFLDFENSNANTIRFEICQIEWDYTIDIDEDIIVVRAGVQEGLFHAAMTLKQLIYEGYKDGISMLRKCTISDTPRLAYRGFMLDVVRYFFNVDTVKRIVDALSLAKINVLHLHLSDNQGFRIESEVFPRLCEVGSLRCGTLGDGKPVSGYFSKADIAEIVRYCSERFIEVIPEIDLPGHTLAILASYPEFGCVGKEYKVAQNFGIDKRILCAGKEIVYEFLYKLLDEVIDLFPSKYFHIGGDEVPKAVWRSCENCQKAIKDHGLKNEEELQGYFTNKIVDHLKSHGKVAIVWNEALKSRSLDESVTVQYWQEMPSAKLVKQAASEGRKVIVSKAMEYYLDYCYGMTSLKRAYGYDPLSIFDEDSVKNVIGVEAPLWTEWIPDEDKLFKQAFPRAFAMAESGWSRTKKNYRDFEERLDGLLGIMQVYDMTFASAEEWNPNPVAAFVQKIKFLRRWVSPENKSKY